MISNHIILDKEFYKEWAKTKERMPIDDIIDLTEKTIKDGVN